MQECCQKDSNRVIGSKFKDVLLTEDGFSYTVYLSYCKECGFIIEEATWVE